MQKRAVRLTILALLIITGLGAGYFTWDIQRRVDDLYAAEREVDARIDRLSRRVLALGGAQYAAVVPGQAQADWLSRGAALLHQIREDVAALRARSRSVDAAAAFDAFADALRATTRTDSRAREHLRIGQELMAADLVFSEGRQSIEEMSAILSNIDVAERNAADDERRALQVQAAAVLGGTALLWLLGAMVLVTVPVRAAVEPPIDVTADQPLATAEAAPPVGAAPVVNMTEAADVCTALSRVTSASVLPGLLGRAAQVLDARGIIVWLGAGEELFAVTTHGYDLRVLARLGPIARQADNATAAAWRSGAMRIVASDMMTNGAIVAPLFGPDGCIGVLAAEVRHGHEADDTTQAVTTMIAAQLAAVVSAWPAPSAVEGPAPGTVDGAAPATVERPAEAPRNDATAATA